MEDKIEKKDEIVLTKEAFETFKAEFDNLKEANKMLLEVADKKSLAKFYARNKEKSPSIINLRTWKGKVIVGWRTGKDDVYQDVNTGRWTEEQTTILFLEDKTETEVSQLEFVRGYRHIPARRIGIYEDQVSGQVMFKAIREDNGKEIAVSSLFVN